MTEHELPEPEEAVAPLLAPLPETEEEEHEHRVADIVRALDETPHSRRWVRVIVTLYAVSILIFAALCWAQFRQIQNLREEQQCRVRIVTADDSAQGQLLLVVGDELKAPRTDPEFSKKLGKAADTLRETQKRRARTNEICDIE